MTRKVLHISAYFAGGTGAACAGLEVEGNRGSTGYVHSQLLLEPTINKYFYNIAEKDGVVLTTTSDENEIAQKIADADIVQLEWWGHPLPFKYLRLFLEIKTRLTMWYHVSGCTYPYLKPELCSIPDKMIFTSPYSYENPNWSKSDVAAVKRNSCVVSSSGGFSRVDNHPLQKHNGFNVGFIGTLSFVKMYPGIVQYLNAIADIDNVKFIMIGDIPKPNLILEQAKQLGIASKFEFTGFVDDAAKIMSTFDVGVHLLNPEHYGTTENSLLEMMSMGLPVIAFHQNCEKYIITPGIDGILIKDKKDFVQFFEHLYCSSSLRKRIGEQARKTAIEKFSLQATVRKMSGVYDQVMTREKHCHDFFEAVGGCPTDWYLSGQNPSGIVNVDAQAATNKSGIGQWRKYYPDENWDKIVFGV